MHELDQLVHALSHLTHELREDREQRKHDNNKAILERLAQMERNIMATQKELAGDLALVLAQQVKTAGEIAAVQEAQNVAIKKIADLEALIAGGAGDTVTQELIDAVAAVKAQAQIVDELIPDVVPPPVEPPVE